MGFISNLVVRSVALRARASLCHVLNRRQRSSPAEPLFLMILMYSDPDCYPNMKKTILAFPFTLEVFSFQMSLLVLPISTFKEK